MESQTQSIPTATRPSTLTPSISNTSPSTFPPGTTPTYGAPSASTSTGTGTDTSTAPGAGTTCVSTPIDTGILDNGDFETGLSPWSLDLVDLFSTDYALAAPGANGSCTAFTVRMAANPQTQDLHENLRLRSDLVFSRPGAVLRVRFAVRFARRNAARLVLSANDQLLGVFGALSYGPGGNGTSTGTGAGAAGSNSTGSGGNGNATDDGSGEGEGEWTRIALDYTARDRLLQLSFSYQLDAAPGNTIGLDQVAIFPSTANRPPLPLPLPLSLPPPPATTLTMAVRRAAK
ncbi:hypothetical protein ANO14919_058970 [Xylariales sp. No.14919]|nr:hypothetical protein ANO14919_058970 [Xylariales sp. No.14919]